MEGWPRIMTERFDGESLDTYRRRSTRIVEIVTGFRMGRYDDEVADKLERELVELQDPGLVLN